jgi:hypothetical protein
VGPEGSVLVLVVIAATWVLFDRIYPPRNAQDLAAGSVPATTSF